MTGNLLLKNDEFGPEYVVKVYDPKIGLEGFLIIDNTTLGPGKGGIRMASDASAKEVFRLARTMTWKNALYNFPFGGAKAWIKFSGESGQDKKEFLQSFARAIKLFTPQKYIAAPDIGTGEKEMEWFVEATGNWRSATGKPANLCMEIFDKAEGKPRITSGARLRGKCGIPHEFGSTGFGVAQATKVAADFLGLKIQGTEVAIAGFGNVGSFTFKCLAEMGAKIVAVSDVEGSILNKNGLNFSKLLKLKTRGKSVIDYPERKKLDREAIYELPVDILIPAAISDVINESNVNKVRAKIIVEAANIPIQEKYEKILHRKGVLIVPDIIANAGGVISSYAEYRGYNPKQMFETVRKKIRSKIKLVLEEALRRKINLRQIALKFAKEKLEQKI